MSMPGGFFAHFTLMTTLPSLLPRGKDPGQEGAGVFLRNVGRPRPQAQLLPRDTWRRNTVRQGKDERLLPQPQCHLPLVTRMSPHLPPEPPASGSPDPWDPTPHSRHPQPSCETPGPRCLGALPPESRRGEDRGQYPVCQRDPVASGAGQPAQAGHTSLSYQEQRHVGWGVLGQGSGGCRAPGDGHGQEGWRRDPGWEGDRAGRGSPVGRPQDRLGASCLAPGPCP